MPKSKTPKRTKKKVVKVKAWAVLDKGTMAQDIDGETYLICRRKPNRLQWHEDFTFVPCEITYTTPNN